MQTPTPPTETTAPMATIDWAEFAQRAMAWEHTPIALGFVGVAAVSFWVGSHHRARGGSRRGQYGWYVAAAWPAIQAFLVQTGILQIGPPN
jgi:hypothetical protein